MQGFVEFFRSLGAARLGAMAAVTIALVGAFAFLLLQVTAPQMTPLFTDLTVEDSASIVKDLERQGIHFELKNEGSTILVPRDKVARTRMKLAETGLPKGGGLGYEIFDKNDTLSATSFVQNINHLRALEGEIARTIRAIDRIQAARVHLVIPERPLFSREKIEPTASIAVKVRGALEPQQVRAIRHLVASAVNGLKPERISIVDEAGRLLADGAQGEGAGLNTSADERQIAYERRLQEQVESIVSKVVGPGRARVQLTADFDFNRITQTSDRFDPEGRVLRSSQTREEQSATTDNQGQVTVGNELPGAQRGNDAQNPREQSKKSEEVTNYEISRVTKTEVSEGGRVKRVSVAVLVDGTYAKAENGDVNYQPRTKEEIDRISALVRSAVGFDQGRGDQVEVINLRFADQPGNPFPEPTGWMAYLQLTKDDIMRAIEWIVMGVLGLVVLLVVVRPLVRRVITPEPKVVTPEGTTVSLEDEEESPPQLSNHAAKMIKIATSQGEIQQQSIQKVGELAQQNPHETVSIIRQWLHDTPN
ncbi:MAG TPA: flagellar basal-body MS-ring/collar protein FliF [Xanthobacteraceae bacterium]|nr:flagellar basal-body MS-ring/collar protein FliF [Xanthobacteraceae bacterium]